jgi:flagellar biosynthetic protein FliR
MVNLALGVLSRAAPQMNLISIGFPVTLLVGMLAFGASLPFLMSLIERHLVASVELLVR